MFKTRWMCQFILTMIVLIFAQFSSIHAQIPYVTSLSWSNDGSQIATVVNNTVEIRDSRTNEVVSTLLGHTGFIYYVAWNFNNSMIATASDDRTVKVWSSSDGTLLQTLIGHDSIVTHVWWSSDDLRLISASFDDNPNLFVWDVTSGKILSTHRGGTITDGAFSPDGGKFAIITSLSLHILDGYTFEVLSSSPRTDCCINQMHSVAWSNDGSLLVTGSINGLVTIWDANATQITQQFIANSYYAPDSREIENLPMSWVRDVAFSPDIQTVLAISGDGRVREWDISTGTLIQDLQISPLYTATWSPYAARLAVLSPTIDSINTMSTDVLNASQIAGSVSIIVPFATMDKVQSLAQACQLPSETDQALTNTMQTDQLTDFIRVVESLPTETSESGCIADLLAVAEAVQASEQK
jgi:WD40 repeat protein